jgi:hypothetical protein
MYIDDLGDEVIDFKAGAMRYIRGFFFIDFFSVIPFDLILGILFGSSGSSLSYTSLLKALKIPRLLRLSRIFKIFEELSVAVFWRLFRLMFTVFIFVHVMACIMGLVLVIEESKWISGKDPELQRYWYHRYLTCAEAISGMLFGKKSPPSRFQRSLADVVA